MQVDGLFHRLLTLAGLTNLVRRVSRATMPRCMQNTTS